MQRIALLRDLGDLGIFKLTNHAAKHNGMQQRSWLAPAQHLLGKGPRILLRL